MTQALPLGAQLGLAVRRDATFDERAQLGEARRDLVRVARELVVPSPRSQELPPPGEPFAPPLGLLAAAEGVEDAELVRGARELPLLELGPTSR